MEPKGHILLVEDNEMLQEIISTRLELKGFRVSIAPDGKQGVEMAIKLTPQLILMDMSLPYMNGWEATEVIRGNEETQDVPIIALTAHALSSDRERGLAVGCNDYLTKPVDFQKLLKKIESLLVITPQET
ncbi:MAG: response regulator [Chloroflexota bacterium]